jgi:hypothetical protein
VLSFVNPNMLTLVVHSIAPYCTYGVHGSIGTIFTYGTYGTTILSDQNQNRKLCLEQKMRREK